MAVESIVCPHCGSGDVTEVKLNTYFCNHCEAISKYFDPSKKTVVSSPAFCTCGNKVEFQCNLCAKGLCAMCDAIAFHKRVERGRAIRGVQKPANPSWLPLIESKDWGYNFQFPATFPATYLSTAAYLPCMKVVNSVENSLGHPNHICMTCVSDAAPRLRKIFEAGGVCTFPACSSSTSYNCACCGYGFCGVHRGLWRKGHLAFNLTFHGQHNPWVGPDFALHASFYSKVDTSTMCLLCISEKCRILYDFALDTFDMTANSHFGEHGGSLQFKSKVTQSASINKYKRLTQSEFRTQMREIEPTLREQEKAVLDTPCRMNEHFESGKREWRIVGIDPVGHLDLEVP